MSEGGGVIMCETCGDNRFEMIEVAKLRLIESTNIECCTDEMNVLDSILFRMWQMGWLPGQERTCHDVSPMIEAFKCSECGTMYYNVDGAINYCPNCGAKVVDE